LPRDKAAVQSLSGASFRFRASTLLEPFVPAAYPCCLKSWY
jgi:hypothetical protein